MRAGCFAVALCLGTGLSAASLAQEAGIGAQVEAGLLTLQPAGARLDEVLGAIARPAILPCRCAGSFPSQFTRATATHRWRPRSARWWSPTG